MSEVYISLQGNNETAWERFITRMWIDNINNNDFFMVTWNKIVSKVYKPKAPQENIQIMMQYKEDELSDVALEYRKTLAPPDPAIQQLKDIQTQMTNLERLIFKLSNTPHKETSQPTEEKIN